MDNAGHRTQAFFGTVRMRTTLATTLVLAVCLVVGGFTFVSRLRSSLVDNVQDAAQLRAEDVGTSLASGSDLKEIAVRDQEGSVVQVMDAQGRVILSSLNVQGEKPVASLEPGETATIDHTPIGEGGDAFRVVAEAARTPDGEVIVLAGGSLEHVTESVRAVTTILLFGIPGLLLVVALTTWLFTGRALRPVAVIRREVADISAKDLDRRVPLPETRDEIARLASTMNEMLDRLADSHHRQRRFISDASHELRSPITTICHQAEVAEEHPDGTNVEDLASNVLAEGHRLESLVEDLLILAKADEHTLALARRAIDLDDLVLEEAERLRSISTLKIDTSGVSAAKIQGHAGSLRRALRNLADNAVRHANTRVSLEVTCDGHTAVVAVVDDGSGIPEKERGRIFERFTRLEDARDRDSGGGGLGLSIVSEIMAAHAGHISVADAPGGGARFELSLPCAEGEPGL